MTTKLIKIKGVKSTSEVVLTRQRGGEDDYVQILAWHTDEEGGLYVQSEELYFEHDALLSAFIRDFSEASANEFAKDFSF